ncbi:hypothetical protein [Mesorhizobium captivum]|uniref:hypothetical protein n=1 Tax=Mesorhizobium captivum TaxID=3072319 RepID=UPI003D6C2056
MQPVSPDRARVVLGGKPHSATGFLPGILEGVLLSVGAGHAVYVLGGFGGAAHLVAAAASTRRHWRPLGRGASHHPIGRLWPSTKRSELPSHLSCCLTSTTIPRWRSSLNHFLFRTASVDASLYLIMKGLMTVRSKLL